MSAIRVGAAVALAGSSLEALDDAWRQATAQLAGADPDIVAVFASAHHAPEAERIADELAVRAPSASVRPTSSGKFRDTSTAPANVAIAACVASRERPVGSSLDSVPR